MNAQLFVLYGLPAAMVLLLAAILVFVLTRRKAGVNTIIHSSIQHMRSIGQLSVFKAITKEIVTETDHSWGSFGQKYLGWVMSGRKMAMIFEFEIDFRYDLRSSQFEIVEGANATFVIRMPPCLFEAHIRDICFYDEQNSRFLPWLLPDLVSGFLAGGFSEAHKNKLVAAAKNHAQKQAVELIANLESEVQNSAKSTLQSISRAFGAENVTFEFLPQGDIKLDVGIAREAVA